MNKLLMIGIVILLIAIFVLAFLPLPGDASSYPPNVKAVVKFKRSITYPEGHHLTRIQKIRIDRNLNNVYRKNKQCPKANSSATIAGYWATRSHFGLAMSHAQDAINEAYSCHDAMWRKKHIK